MAQPRFRTRHLNALAIGMGYHDGKAHYLSSAGPANALKAIWATGVARNQQHTIVCNEWTRDPFKLPKCYQLWAEPTPGLKHLCCVSKDPAALIAHDNRGAQLWSTGTAEQRFRHSLSLQNQDAITQLAFNRLSAYTAAPLQPGWMPKLLSHALRYEQDAIQPMRTYGDCILAYYLNLDYPWDVLVAELIRRGDLAFDQATEWDQYADYTIPSMDEAPPDYELVTVPLETCLALYVPHTVANTMRDRIRDSHYRTPDAQLSYMYGDLVRSVRWDRNNYRFKTHYYTTKFNEYGVQLAWITGQPALLID